MKKYVITIMTMLVTIGIFAAPQVSAQAQEAPVQSARCAVAEARLELRVTRVGAARENHAQIYSSIKSRLDTVVENATSAGYDTTDLVAARDSVQQEITTFTEKSDAYYQILTETKNLACGNSDGEFVASLADARLAMVELRTASIAVKTTVRQEAIPAVKDYAAWLKEQATSTQSQSTEEN